MRENDWVRPFEHEKAAIRLGVVQAMREFEWTGHFEPWAHPRNWTQKQKDEESAFVHYYSDADYRVGYLIAWEGGTRLWIQLSPTRIYQTWFLNPAIEFGDVPAQQELAA